MHNLKAADIEVALLMNFEKVPNFKRLVMYESVAPTSLFVQPSAAAEVVL